MNREAGGALSGRTILGVALMLSFLFRLVLAFLSTAGFSPRGDEGGYIFLADTLLRDGTFGVHPTAYRLPLYPMLLGAVQCATGVKVPAYLVLNAFLGTAAVFLIYRIALHLAGERAARISLLLSVPNPFLMANTPYVLTENLYIPLVLGFLLALLVAQDDGPAREGAVAVWRRWFPWAVAGLLLGLCNLTRSTMLGFGIFLPFCCIFVERRIGPKVRGAILLLVLSVLLLVPWWVRNAAVFGHFIPATTSEGFVLLGAYNEKAFTDPVFIGSWVNYEKDINPAPFRDRTEYERDRIAYAMAKEYAAANWTGIPRILPWRLLRAFYWYPNVIDRFAEAAGPRRLSSIWGFLFTVVLVYPMVATEGVRRFRDRRFLAPFLLVAWFLLVILAAYGNQRIRLPIEGVLIVFAAAGWDRLTGKEHSTSR